MTGLSEHVVLGGTGLEVSRLGVGSSYGVSTRACRAAFDAGVNYFFWGSVRTVGMGLALRELGQTHRDELVVVLQSYVRSPKRIGRSVRRGLAALRLDHADLLVLGWHDEAPAEDLLEAVERLRDSGMIRFVAISSHQRALFPSLLGDRRYDVFHVRYNAAHRGAEGEVFPYLPADRGPGIVSFTNTRWGDLLQEKHMPEGHAAPTAADCYRFSLSHPAVHVAICGPKNDEEMRTALDALRQGPMHEEDLARMRVIGDHVHGVRSMMSALS